MHKEEVRFVETGGCGFEAFGEGDRAKRLVGADAAGACFGCHEVQAGPDFVFSELRP
jgi:Cytochrome P460